MQLEDLRKILYKVYSVTLHDKEDGQLLGVRQKPES